MKVAIVGGTGAFGRALARRLRVARRGRRTSARATPSGPRERALELGVEGGTNEDVVRGADLVVLATKSNATLETAVALADAIGETPVLCVASDLRFTDTGIVPGLEEGSLAEHVSRLIRAPVASGLQMVSAIDLSGPEPPDQDVLICGDDLAAKELALELAGRLVGGRAIDVGPLANSRALEAHDRRDPEREQATTASTRASASPACRDLDPAGRGAAGDRGRGPTSAR